MDLQKLKFKIVLFGDKGVGRSTLLKDLRGPFEEHYRKSIGAGFSEKVLHIENRRVQLYIWDISHELRTHQFLLPSFLKSSGAAFLMFDITSVASFNFLSEVPELIRKYVGDIPIWLVGNKLDLENAREVSEEVPMIFAKHKNVMGYMEISAKSGQGCEEFFERVGSFLYNSHKDLVEEEKFIRKKKKKQKKRSRKKKSQKE